MTQLVQMEESTRVQMASTHAMKNGWMSLAVKTMLSADSLKKNCAQSQASSLKSLIVNASSMTTNGEALIQLDRFGLVAKKKDME